jgi:hypothetical protein
LSGAQLIVFPFLLAVLPIVAAIACWLKRHYTGAVVRLQNEAASSGIAQSDSSSSCDPAPAGLLEDFAESSLRIMCAREVPSHLPDHDCGATYLALRRRVLAVQFAGALTYWLALVLFLAGVMTGLVNPVPVLVFVGPTMLLLIFMPAVIAWAFQAGVRHAFINVPAVLIVATGLALQLTKGGWETALGSAVGYASIAVAVSAFLRPSLRGAGLPLMTAAGVAWLVFTGLLAIGVALDESPEDAQMSILEIIAAFVLITLMLGAALWCGWRTLLELARKYSSKRFSDMQLALGMYWALLTAFIVASALKDQTYLALTGSSPGLVCVGIVLIWLLWRWLQSMALRGVVRTAPPAAGALLFLRVFKPSARSELFADRFFAYWRFAGPVWMIAGPDLAGAYMEPTEFFAYIRRRLREHFVGDPREAAARVEALDNERDPDGRFRINELLCSNETWRPAVLRMAARADIILLDLREYSHQRKGTRFELTEILRRAPLQKVLLLIDDNAEVTRLTGEIASIWRAIAHTREAAGSLGDLRILLFGRGSSKEMHGLFRASVRAASLA